MEKIKFSDRHISVGGVLSIALGSVAILLVIAGVTLSFMHQGEGPLLVGALGIAAVLFDLAGLVIGLLSFKESDKYYKTSIVGSMMCGIFLVLLIGIILV